MPVKLPKARSPGEESLALHLRAAGIAFEREVSVVPGRGWRWDFKIGDLLVEIQGGTENGGRHVRPAGYQEDCDKQNEAVLLGYRVFKFTTTDVKQGKALAKIEQFREGI